MKRRVQPEVSTEGDSLLGDELEDAGAEEAPPAVDNAPEDAALPEEDGGEKRQRQTKCKGCYFFHCSPPLPSGRDGAFSM